MAPNFWKKVLGSNYNSWARSVKYSRAWLLIIITMPVPAFILHFRWTIILWSEPHKGQPFGTPAAFSRIVVRPHCRVLTSPAVDLLGRDGRVLEVHGQVRGYLEVYQRYGGERQHELGDGQTDGERLLEGQRRPMLHARLVQLQRPEMHHLDVLVQQQRHHGRERHHPDEHQCFGHAAPEHRAPRVPDYREVPAAERENLWVPLYVILR